MPRCSMQGGGCTRTREEKGMKIHPCLTEQREMRYQRVCVPYTSKTLLINCGRILPSFGEHFGQQIHSANTGF